MYSSGKVFNSGLTHFLIKDMVLKLSSPALSSTPKLKGFPSKGLLNKEADQETYEKII